MVWDNMMLVLPIVLAVLKSHMEHPFPGWPNVVLVAVGALIISDDGFNGESISGWLANDSVGTAIVL
nr:hypothetical protein Iba_chr10fCG0190 [Ipomoea batatas]